MSSSWACATCCKSIFSHLFFFCSSPRLGRSSRSSALGSRFRDSSSSSYSIKNTADIYKKYPGSTSPLESPLLARSRKTSIVDSYLNCEKKEEACNDNSHEVIDYKELYEKEKREKEVSNEKYWFHICQFWSRTWILISYWSKQITWPQYWPLIGEFWSRDLKCRVLALCIFSWSANISGS